MEICYPYIMIIEIIVCTFNVVVKVIQGILCKKLVKDSADMGKATNKIICNIKKQFDKEYSRMKKINNVNMFVYKNMYGIKVMGLKINVWELLGIVNIMLCALLGAAAAFMAYINSYDEQYIIMHVLFGFVMGFVIILCDLLLDMNHKMEHVHINICEYLENKYIPMMESSETVFESLPYEAHNIDEGIRELFRLMSEDNEESKEYVEDISAETIANDMSLDEKEGKILKDVLEEYLA